MRQHCRNNVNNTMFSDQQTVDYSIMSIFVAATPFRNPGPQALAFFGFFLVFEPLPYYGACLVVDVAKLNNCRPCPALVLSL